VRERRVEKTERTDREKQAGQTESPQGRDRQTESDKQGRQSAGREGERA